MRVNPRRPPPSEEVRHRIARLERIPLRPLTARTLSTALAPETDDEFDAAPRSEATFDLPARPRMDARRNVAPPGKSTRSRSWPKRPGGRPLSGSAPAGDFIGRLWRYSVAVSVAARSLARDAGDPDPDGVARAGLLCRLGCWAVAAVDPEWMARWWQDASAAQPAATRACRPGHRSGRPRPPPGRALGLRAAGRRRSLVAWHSRFGSPGVAAEPTRLAYIQQACRWAKQTPWSLAAGLSAEGMPADPRLRILVAEVQARTGTGFRRARREFS